MSQKRKEHIKKITSIGGSALIEGIMMKGPKRTMIAGRLPNGEIYKEEMEFKSIGEKFPILRKPVIRGLGGMIDSMSLSYKALMISAEKSLEEGEETNEEPSKFEKWVDKVFGENFMKVLMIFASIIGVALAIGLFFVLPTWLFNTSANAIGHGLVENRFARSVLEGILRIVLFLAYIIACSQMSDMKRVFKYHGAEHKTIFCYESEEELTVENVKKHTRFHPRCGTSFLVIMLLLGIIIGLFIPAINPFLRGAIKILLLPVTCGIGYELIKICGKYDNKITAIIAAPGLWAQRITTKEPDAEMIEIAIAAMKEVIPEDGTDIVKGS
ncbi:membrane protein [Clostridia bacterium]|nr:membrane protein [Clostridia bacterium]